MSKTTSRPTPLPPLPFGERLGKLNADPQIYGDHVAAVVPSLQAYDALGDKNEFRSKSVALEINGLKLASGASTAVSIDVGSSTNSNLLIPFFGNSVTLVGQRSFNWDAGQNALYLPPIERVGKGSSRSYLHIDIESARLQQSARAMLGLEAEQTIDFYLDQPRLLPLRSPGRDADKSWRHICMMIDPMCDQPDLLAQLGVDELIYRNTVLMLRPDLFEKTSPQGQTKDMRVVSQRALDPLCSFIQSKLEERITLTDMERISGMSSRALQYAFLQRYNCTPMLWMRNARLDRARDMLRQNDQYLTIGVVAERLGFAKHSTFSALFTARFGEAPSAVLTRLDDR